ncbi:MAG: cation/H(+) antiporter, partial [Paludibacter sp.]|nr:cation/H(+) antiporter [Paludibacter sp.]
MQKKHIRTWMFYILMVASFIILTYVLFKDAVKFDVYQQTSESVEKLPLSNFDSFKTSIFHNIAEPTAMLLLQIIAILLVSRVLGFVFVKIGQPTVIAEIL